MLITILISAHRARCLLERAGDVAHRRFHLPGRDPEDGEEDDDPDAVVKKGLAGDFGLEGDRVRNTASRMLTYSGIAVLHPELFAGQQDGVWPLAPLLRDAADRSILAGELHEGVWVDTGTPERLEKVDQLIRASR